MALKVTDGSRRRAMFGEKKQVSTSHSIKEKQQLEAGCHCQYPETQCRLTQGQSDMASYHKGHPIWAWKIKDTRTIHGAQLRAKRMVKGRGHLMG